MNPREQRGLELAEAAKIHRKGDVFEGSRATQTRAGRYVLDVSASGPWAITIEQPRPQSAPQTTSFEGTGQGATDFVWFSAGLKRFAMTHQGSGHFAVTLLDKDGARAGMDSLLANDVGPFDGSKAIRIPKDDIYLLQVEAGWTLDDSGLLVRKTTG